MFDLIRVGDGESFSLRSFLLNRHDAIDRTALLFHRFHSFGQGKCFHSSLHLFDSHLAAIGRLFCRLLHIDQWLFAQFPQNHRSITIVQIGPFARLECCRRIHFTRVGGVEEMVGSSRVHSEQDRV